MPQDEKLVMQKAADALLAGDIDKATELIKTIPLIPEVADGAAKVLGIDYLQKAGFDLSAAEAKYGPEWLKQHDR